MGKKRKNKTKKRQKSLDKIATPPVEDLPKRPKEYTRSKYKMNNYWKMLNGMTVVSILCVLFLYNSFDKYFNDYGYYSELQPYELGLENQPIYLVANPQTIDLSKEDQALYDLFDPPVLYADISLSYEVSEKFEGQSRETKTYTVVNETLDLSEQLFVLYNDQRLMFDETAGDYWDKGDGSTEYWGLEEVDSEYDLDVFKTHFGEDAKTATKMSIQAFPQQETTIYGQVQSKSGAKRLVSARKQALTLSTMPHAKLVQNYKICIVFIALAMLSFLGSRFYVWRGRLLHKYLSYRERYWVFNPGDGSEMTGFWIIIGFCVLFGVVKKLELFSVPIQNVEVNAAFLMVLCVLLNRLKSLEFFYVSDRQTQELILVHSTWTKSLILPIAKLQDLSLSSRVSRNPQDSTDTTYYIVGESKTLGTPEVNRLYSNGKFHGDMYEMNRDGWADFTYTFEQWRTP